MKYIKTAVLAFAVLVLAGVPAQPARADVSFEFAYSNLSQHGSWLVSAEYGRVWQPREYNREWNPYYDGHWVDTDMGWTWVSDYQWGSIPYHYGTWVIDPRYGWIWIPGDVWAPSWVVFRTSPEYIGWAPVPPGFSVGVSIEFGAPSSFIFVSSRDFLAPRLRTAIIPAARTNVFINNTTVINNIVVQNNVVINRGPDVRIIEKATGRTIRQQPIERVSRVAPFEHVSRAQLAVAPEQVKRGLRVAEPVPESRPLPVAENRGRPDHQGRERAPAPAPTQESAPKPRGAQIPSTHAIRKPNADRRTNEQAAAPEAPRTRRAATPAEPTNKPNVERRANEQAAAPDVPRTRRNATPPAEPTNKPNAEPSGKAQPKAKANSKAKKDDPEKKEPSPDKGQ